MGTQKYISLLVILLSFSFGALLYSQDKEESKAEPVAEKSELTEISESGSENIPAMKEEESAKDKSGKDSEVDGEEKASVDTEPYKVGEIIDFGPSSEFLKQKELIIKADFLVLNRMKIYRHKMGERLSFKEAETYLKFIQKGGLYKDIVVLGHMAQIKSGSELMRHISYEHLYRVLNDVYKRTKLAKADDKSKGLVIPPLFYGNTGKKKRKRIKFSHPFVLELTNGGKESVRRKLIESSLGGLVNPDPRVRLVSTHMLRRLIPDPKIWEFVNSRIKEQESGKTKDKDVRLDSSEETVKVLPYQYLTMDKQAAARVIYTELLKLRRFISRFIVVKEARKGSKAIFKKLPGKKRTDVLQQREIFKFFNTAIENESYCRLPINNFKSESEVNFLIGGLKNKDHVIRKGCSSSLIRILRTRDEVDSKTNVKPRVKRKIFKALIKSEEKQRVVSGWSTEELSDLSKKSKNVNKMIELYVKKVGMIDGCPEDAEDKYDSSSDPAGFTPPPPLKDNPLTKEEYDAVDTSKPKKKDIKPSTSKDEKLETEYIYE
ncbi:MAG: hypothetical protein OEZ36_03195 [Spirochaetota bacterium]|nr:hypothetical protein [Spirochaetota bacterium]